MPPGRPAIIPKNYHVVDLEDESDMESVAEKQGSARLFAAFKKNFTSIKNDVITLGALSRQYGSKYQSQKTQGTLTGRASQTRAIDEPFTRANSISKKDS